MNNTLKIGSKVVLISFNGSTTPDKDTEPHENYWQLINLAGVVVKDPNREGIFKTSFNEKRVLVQFEQNIKSLGLECHNPIDNSLWIRIHDLKEIKNYESEY